MDLTNKKLKAYIVVSKDGENLIEKIKDDPFSYILNESNFNMHFDNDNVTFLSYAFYTDFEYAKDFAHWWTGNCGEVTLVKEIEITIGETKYDSEEDFPTIK